MFSFEIDPIHYIIVAVTSAAALYKIFIRPKVRKWADRFDHLDEIPQIKDTVTTIQKQVFPNGGGSVVDGLNRVERRIVTLEEKQNLFLMDNHMGVFETDTAGRWISVNRTLCRMLLCTEKELLGRGWMNFMSGDMIERYNHAIANEIEFKMVAKMKSVTNAEVNVSIIANPLRSNLDKTMIGYLGTIDETIE